MVGMLEMKIWDIDLDINNIMGENMFSTVSTHVI